MDVLANPTVAEFLNPSSGITANPIVKVNGVAKIKIDATFHAHLQLSADFSFSYTVWGGNVHLYFELHGKYEVALRMDLTFQAALTIEIKHLLQWSSTDKILWVGDVVPILYHPFLELGVDVETQPIPLFGAAVQFQVSQKFSVAYRHYSGWLGELCKIHLGSLCKDGYHIVDDSDPNFEDPVPKISIMPTAITDTNAAAECPTALQNFGFDVKPYIRVGAVFYEVVGVYAKPQLNFQFKLTMHQSDGPTCGADKSYDMCHTASTLERGGNLWYPMNGSWSIDFQATFSVGLKAEPFHDLLDKIWERSKNKASDVDEKYIKVADWLLKEKEFPAGKYPEKPVRLASSCFMLPKGLHILYAKWCCGMQSSFFCCLLFLSLLMIQRK